MAMLGAVVLWRGSDYGSGDWELVVERVVLELLAMVVIMAVVLCG